MAKFDTVEWMTQHGKTAYRDEIESLERFVRIARSNADMETNPVLVQEYEAKIEQYEREILDVRQQAQDRYEDWVSDMDY